MPAIRFSWDNFDDKTVTALVGAMDYDGDRRSIKEMRAFLTSKAPRPTLQFVSDYKGVILHTWLRHYPGTKDIVHELLARSWILRPVHEPQTPAEYIRYLEQSRNTKKLKTLILNALLRYGDQDRTINDGGEGFVRRFVSLAPSKQPVDSRKPHSYQLEAWNRLSKHHAESSSTGEFQGLVVMPTGSGKTYTVVSWLLTTIISQGMRVLWLAHQRELLTQAGAEFQQLAGMARPSDKQLRIRIVSSVHCSASKIDPADDIVVASIGSLRHRPDITEQLIDDPNVFVVIDEAHHAPAKSYRSIINRLKAKKPFRLLGLTATPTRTVHEEKSVLSELFGGRIIHQTEVKTLIEKQVLSRPHIVSVKTNAKVEEGITANDRRHYDRFNELSDEWLNRIAKLEQRNSVIIQHYLDNRDRYGQTLIFAISIPHAALLAEQLREHGVDAEYVASSRPDGTEGEPATIIQQFRDERIKVLVNVQMMTEGVDVPTIKTVFLARPTSSEILLRQMIGRGLRGPKVKGTDIAYLVSFEDHWQEFNDWQSPFDLVPDIIAVAEFADAPPKPLLQVIDVIPWELIRNVAANFRGAALERKADVFEAIPHGWYIISVINEGTESRQIIPVYEHQRVCWEEFFKHCRNLNKQAPQDLEVETIYDRFFADCDYPWPSKHELSLVINHLAQDGESPEYNDFNERKLCDPYLLAQEIWDHDLSERTKRELVQQRYSELAQAIYPTLREFDAAIADALHELAHPEDSTRTIRAVPVFEPLPEQQLSPGPAHNLDIILTETLAQGCKLLGVESLPINLESGSPQWTHRPVRGWYAMAYYETTTPPGYGRVRVNKILDSPDITRETLKFLLWHEYLHLYLKQPHTKEFRRLERLWPGYIEADRMLDNLNERFGHQEW